MRGGSLLGGQRRRERHRAPLPERGHEHRFVSWVYRREGGYDATAVRRAIAEMPSSVYRIKGFLYDAYDPDRRQLVQAVGMRSDVHPLGSWTDGRRETVLVIIAERDHIDPHDVNSPLDACLVAPPRRSAVPVPSADAGTWRRGTYRCLLTTFSGWV